VLADICGVEIEVLSTQAADATSLGAAVAAGVGVGLFRDLADGVKAVRVEQRYPPDATTRVLYDRPFSVYRSLYPALKKSFQRMKGTGA